MDAYPYARMCLQVHAHLHPCTRAYARNSCSDLRAALRTKHGVKASAGRICSKDATGDDGNVRVAQQCHELTEGIIIVGGAR